MRSGRRSSEAWRSRVAGAARLVLVAVLAASLQARAQTAPAPIRESLPAGALVSGKNAAPTTPAATSPAIKEITPSELTPGQSYTLNLAGVDLQATMQLDLGPGIVVSKAIEMEGTSRAHVGVQVLAGAPAGRRLVTVTYTPPATLSGRQPLRTQGPGYVDVVAPAGGGPVVLDLIAPRQVQQGQQVVLTLRGSGFAAGMGVSFGPGISAGGPVVVLSPAQATVAIQVAAQAPAILRHPTLLVTGRDARVSSDATLTVAPAAGGVVVPAPVPIQTASVPVILAVAPQRVFTGQKVTLTLRGQNLVPQLALDLGPGITRSGGLKVQSPSLATLDVAVDGGAAPGMRWIGLQVPSAAAPIREDASLLVQRSVIVPVHAVGPQPASCAAAKPPQQGAIVLDDPLFADMGGDTGTALNVPVLNDQTNFTWHEANPGLADRVEVRFYSGSTLVATRALTAKAGYALPHNLQSDPALIAELTSKVAPLAKKIGNIFVVNGQPMPTIAWDLTWQVVGLHTYYDSCVSPSAVVGGATPHLIAREQLGQGHEVIVDQSKAVPIKGAPNPGDPLLDLTAGPTGLACGTGLASKVRRFGGGTQPPPPLGITSILLQNTSRAVSQTNNRAASADYVGDVWKISGTLDLTNSPWAFETQPTQPPSPGHSNMESESINNLFIDWGDGKIEPFNIQWNPTPCGNENCFSSNLENGSASIFALDNATNQGAFAHAYPETGHFIFRIYALPAAAVQGHGALPTSLQGGGGGLFAKLVPRAAGTAAGSGDLAFELYCQPIDIQPRTDDVAIGQLQLKAIRITGFPGSESSSPAHGVIREAAHVPGKALPRQRAPLGTGSNVPQFSSCDVSLVGGAAIDFYGEGTAKLTWYQDGVKVGEKDEPIGPSTLRNDQQLTPPQAAPILTTWPDLHSPALPLASAAIGPHELQVTAEVEKDTRPIGHLVSALGNLAAHPGTAAPASGALAGAPPLGVLGPRSAVTAGLPPIAWLNETPTGAPGASLHLGFGGRTALGTGQTQLASHPPEEVASAPAPYATTSANPAEPCTFNFPVKGGAFTIAGLQHGGKATVQISGGQVSGSGVLQAALADTSGTATQPEPIPIELKGWTLKPDNVTVAGGDFDVHPGSAQIALPGAMATLDRIRGTAGADVEATLTAWVANPDIQTVNASPPDRWKGVEKPLSPQGDWFADQLSIAPLHVYDSGFTLTAASVTLDFSQVDGAGADALCAGGSGGKAFMGVVLSQAQLKAFDFDLQNAPTTPVSGWALDGYGFCGKATFPAAHNPMDRGSLDWTSVAASAAHGGFTATYNGLKVHVPWLNVDLTAPQGATTQLTAGHGFGTGGINLNLTSPSKVTLTEGPITLTASNLTLSSVSSAGGWAVKSDTTLTFNAPQGQYASNVALKGLAYGMNGAASFEDGSTSRHLSLAGQKGNIGGALVDLKSVDVQVSPASSPTRLAFAFDSTLTLSKTLPAADVPVSYSISEPARDNYVGAGPVTTPVKLDKDFPDANPTVHISIKPTYVGASGSPNPSSSGILFSSNLDLGMFGGPPVSGQFVLGYVGTSDYWLAKAMLDLGPTGVPIVPPVINLYKVGGGLGYNVSLSSFQDPDLTHATPVNDGNLVFDASLVIGSPDHTTFGLSGDFAIKPGGQDPGGRMDYHAWLLNPDWSGQSPFWGHFSYSGGVFDGTLNAHLSLLNDQVALDALNDAIHMHVGGGLWYFHVGTQANPVSGHVFFVNGQAWADLGSDGFMLGLIARLDVTAGDCGGACAYIHDDWQLGASMTPSPLAFSANASQSFNLGACAGGFCLGANASAGVSLGLPPPSLSFSFNLGSCPPGQISIGLEVLPSLSPNVSGGPCL